MDPTGNPRPQRRNTRPMYFRFDRNKAGGYLKGGNGGQNAGGYSGGNNGTNSGSNSNNVNHHQNHPQHHQYHQRQTQKFFDNQIGDNASQVDFLRQNLEKLMLEVETMKERIRVLELSAGTNEAVGNKIPNGPKSGPNIDQTFGKRQRNRQRNLAQRPRGQRVQGQVTEGQALDPQIQPHATFEGQSQASVEGQGQNVGVQTSESGATVGQNHRTRQREDRFMTRRRRAARDLQKSNRSTPSRQQPSDVQNQESPNKNQSRAGAARGDGNDEHDDDQDEDEIDVKQRKRFVRKKRYQKVPTRTRQSLGYRNSRRHRVDSSERNSNDTSPQDDLTDSQGVVDGSQNKFDKNEGPSSQNRPEKSQSFSRPENDVNSQGEGDKNQEQVASDQDQSQVDKDHVSTNNNKNGKHISSKYSNSSAAGVNAGSFATGGHNTQNKMTTNLTESEIDDLVSEAKMELIQPSSQHALVTRKALKEVQHNGAKVFFKFSNEILDHCFCDAKSVNDVKNLAENMYDLYLSQRNWLVDSFTDSITDICERESDIALDAPRYLETLGQFLATIVSKYFDNETRRSYQHSNGLSGRSQFCRKFVNLCIDKCKTANRANLIANIFKYLVELKNSQHYSQRIWIYSKLSLLDYFSGPEGQSDMEKFVDSNELQFLLQCQDADYVEELMAHNQNKMNESGGRISKSQDLQQDLESFADNISKLIDSHEDARKCLQLLDEKRTCVLPSQFVDYQGTMIYALMRGCLIAPGDDTKLDNELLVKRYLSVLQNHNGDQNVAMYALVALTKMWHQLNSPKDLLTTMFQCLHAAKAVTPATLQRWLESEDLHGVPGIGAARLNTKRYIQELNKQGEQHLLAQQQQRDQQQQQE